MQSHDSLSGSSGGDHRLALIHEMSAHNFDLIRFASYRTASKLRFIQKKVSLHAVDIWNVIEAFREQGLHALEPSSELSVARLETLLCSLYHSLNKRAPPTQQAHVDVCSSLLLNWLLAAYATVDNVGKIRVFSIKVALATLCAGKLMDKLRYVFSQISDGNGLLIQWRFNEYLQEVLALPAAVYESPTFNYTDSLANTIFSPNVKITVNDFLDTLMSDPGPPSLVWLPLMHRIANVENVIHPVQCDACQRENFTGFRYRCQKCPHYTLCQECFWKGRVSAPHNLDHQVKEYSSFSPSKTIGQSLRKSFRCVPDKQKNNLPRFPEQPEKTLNLSHIVPPSPIPSHNGFPDGNNFTPHFDGMGSLDSRSTARSLDSARDDEHRLIARYAAKLAQEARSGMSRSGYRKNSLSPDTGRVPSETCLGMDSTRAQRELISQLEAKNREIMREIARLRRQQELEATSHGADNPVLMNELRALRMRKDELETHLTTLQDSRRQLMIQLEGLMKMLKNHQSSPRSTPNSSPRSTKSPPLLPGGSAPQPTSIQQQQQQQQQQQLQQTNAPTRSAPQTPIMGAAPSQNPSSMLMMGAGGGVVGGANNMQNDMRSNPALAGQGPSSSLSNNPHNNSMFMSSGGQSQSQSQQQQQQQLHHHQGSGGQLMLERNNDLMMQQHIMMNSGRERDRDRDRDGSRDRDSSRDRERPHHHQQQHQQQQVLHNNTGVGGGSGGDPSSLMMAGVGGDVRNAFGGGGTGSSSTGGGVANMGSNGNGTPGSVGRSLRNDLLVAADSVTNAMSTLVRELNSEPMMVLPQSEAASCAIRKPLDFEDDGEDESDGGWQQELQRRYAQDANFMAELRARHPTSPLENHHHHQHQQQFQMNHDRHHQPQHHQLQHNQHLANSMQHQQNNPQNNGSHHHQQQQPQGYMVGQQQGYHLNFNQNETFAPQQQSASSESNAMMQQPDQNNEICSDEGGESPKETMSKETMEFEEALKQWVNR